MERFYSRKSNEDRLLHIVIRRDEDTDVKRVDVVPDDQFIQCAILNLDDGVTFRPHRHIWKEGQNRVIAQESWIVIKGRVLARFYDIDNTILTQVILEAGDASITLEGGHTYEILEDGTRVLEYKTGPYSGIENDKVFIDD